MPTEANIENLFANHTFAEIEKVRHNLGIEVDKKTEQIKSIVKDKYKDVVEATDATKEMKNILSRVEESLGKLDQSIQDYQESIDGVTKLHVRQQLSSNIHSSDSGPSKDENEIEQVKKELLDKFDEDCKLLFEYPSLIWQRFDNGDLIGSVALLKQANALIEKLSVDTPESRKSSLSRLQKSITRTREMVVNKLCYIIEMAPPDQVGIISGDGEKENEELHELCLNGAISVLCKEFKDEVLDLSLTSLTKKSQTFSTIQLEHHPVNNEVEHETKQSSSDRQITNSVTIPNHISLELHSFLFKVCQNINKIAGFNLSRSSMILTLSASIEIVCLAYEQVYDLILKLPPSLRRRRSLQLYFDLLFIRSLIATSKNVDLEENLIPKIIDITNMYETILDSIELYVISDLIQTSLARACHRSIKLFGLLIPYH